MKYISTFVIALLLVGAGALIYRTAVLTEPSEGESHTGNHSVESMDHSDEHPVNHSGHANHGQDANNEEDGHGDHASMDHSNHTESDTVASESGSSEEVTSTADHTSHSAAPPPSTNPEALKGLDFSMSIAGKMRFKVDTRDGVTHLNNSLDPVNGEELGDGATLIEHKGFAIRFASERNANRFVDDPIQYRSRLALEELADGSWKHVDSSSYTIAWAKRCFHMGGVIDYEADTYLLHRGFKFYFCCWPGECGDTFMKDPTAAYGHYGLHEMGGKLMANAAHATTGQGSNTGNGEEGHGEHSNE